ncbi:putative cytochrome P450 12a5, mitochondrial [Chionoecetes opilio]|uniref:Putative cytochrome P450 12a5, mitochondrial n=1 Tax=Chionoecetes opilio TaxID=41210 RepID=A0A8J5D0L2_CHIOP|nr:putative cytochrome P450 12a5, mitochondrial [Chionoecetes opilio]
MVPHFCIRLADSNIRDTEASLLALGTEDREVTLLEKLLLTPGLSRKDVTTLILDMLFAGIDTTSHSMAFTLYLLARHPEAQAKLQEEVDGVLRGHEGPLTERHLAQLTYLKAVIKESLRIFPLVVGVARTLDKDLILDDYLIPKGWSMLGINMLTGWDERFFPRVKEFVPERWLRHKPLGPIHPYASLPFGAGTRMCIGRRLAEQEMYIFLTRVMERFTVEYKYEDIEIVTKLVNTPSRPLRFNLIERS